MSYHSRTPGEGDRAQGRGYNRGGRGALPARQAQDGYGSSGVGIGGNAIHDASNQVEERPFAWGGGPNARDRAGHARKRGPSVPGPANVAASSGNHMQSLGTITSRNNAAGGMQSLGAAQSSRAAPKAAASAASAAPAAAAGANAGAASSASEAAESASAGSSHAPSAPSAAEPTTASSSLPATSQVPAASASGASAPEQNAAPGQKDGAEAESGQPPTAQTGQSSQSTPPATQGTGSQQPHRHHQQPSAPSSNNQGPVPVHKQNGQFQGPRGNPQAHRWGRGQQPGRGSAGRHHHPNQHDRHITAFPPSPVHHAQYGVFGPGSPPMYPGQGAMSLGPVFGALQPIPFGTVPLGAYQHVAVPQMPAGGYVPGPSQHTLHPNAPQFIPSQGLPPMSPTLRQVPYHAQAAVMPGVPNEAPLHPPYASAPAPQAGAWQHESPPTTPRLQASTDILRVSGEDPDGSKPSKSRESEAAAKESGHPKTAISTAAEASQPAKASLQQSTAAPAAQQPSKPAAAVTPKASSSAEPVPTASEDTGKKLQTKVAETSSKASTGDKPTVDAAEQSAGPKPSPQAPALGESNSASTAVGEPQAESASASNNAAAPKDSSSASAEAVPVKAEPADASRPLPKAAQASQDRRGHPRQAAPAPRPKAAAVQQRSAMQSGRQAAAPQPSALPATAGWARRRMPAPTPEPQVQAAPEPPAAAQPAQTAQTPSAAAPDPARQQPPASAGPSKAEKAVEDSPSSVAGMIAPQKAPSSSSTATSKPRETQQKDPPAPAEAPKANPEPASAPAPTQASEQKSADAPGTPPIKDSEAGTAPEQAAAEPTPAASSGPANSAQAADETANESLPPPKAAAEPAAAAAPAAAPAQQQAPAEAPKPKTWANMAAKLSESGSSAAFKPPPKAPVSRTLSTASSGTSVQSSRGEPGRDRSSRGQSRDPVRPNGQEAQRRGRGGQPVQRPGREERPVGGRGRDARRNTREAHPDSSAASRDREGSSTVSPRAVPAKPPVSRTAVAAPSSDSQHATQQPAEATAAPQEEAAPVEGVSEPAAETADSSSVEQAESAAASAVPSEAPAQIDSNDKAPTEASSAAAKQEAPAEAAATPKPPAAAKPKQAEPTQPKPLSGPLLAAVQRLCASVDESSAESASSQPLMPRGLVNTGNLCFMNSILQALMGGKDFCGFLQQLQGASPALSAPELPTLHALSALAAEFQPVTTSAESSGGAADGEKGKKDPEYKAKADAPKSAWTKPNAQGASGLTLAARLNQQALLPDMMFPTVNRFNPDNGQPLPTSNGKTSVSTAAAAAAAANRQQEDAQEFLSFLLDSAHQELLRLKARISAAPGAAADGAEKPEEGDGEEWLTAGRSKKRKAVTRGTTSLQGGVTPASDLFGGALRSEVRAQGAPPSATLEPCFLVHLDIHSENVHSITDALSAFTSPETITGYKVKDNSEAVTARKVVQLFQLPRILVLHLKRFSYTLNGTGKIHKPINYGERLRMQPSWIAELCPEPRHRGGAEYELIAAVLHHGKTPSAGHYTADVRQRDNKWLRFDDADLSYVPVDRVVNDARAYLLFYQLRT